MPKNELTKIRHLTMRINRKLLEVEQLESMINRVTPTLRADCVQGGTSDKVDSIIRLIELRTEANELIDQYVDTTREINRILDSMDDPLLAEILSERYIDGHTWEQIAANVNFQQRQVYRLHGQALQEFKKMSVNVSVCQ